MSGQPTTFDGVSSQDACSWLRDFQQYADFKELSNEKRLLLLKVLLKGPAADWVDGLTTEQQSTFEGLSALFIDRYGPPKILKFRAAKQLFVRQQEQNESADSYITSIQKIGREISAAPTSRL